MTCSQCLSLALAACAVFSAALTAYAGPMNVVVDYAENKGKLLDDNFRPYGFEMKKTISRETPEGVQFLLPADTKDVKQTGLNSVFSIAGDFEISVSFEWLDVPAPTDGYGASCGIAIDTNGPGGNLSLVRVARKGAIEGFLVTRGTPDKDKKGMSHKDEKFEPDKSKKGKLVLRRVRSDVICLVGDGTSEELTELHKVKFTDATIKTLRLYADPGGSPTAMNIYLGDLLIRAEEVSHDIAKRDRRGWFWWWLTGGVVVVGAAAAYWFVRRRRQVA